MSWKNSRIRNEIRIDSIANSCILTSLPVIISIGSAATACANSLRKKDPGLATRAAVTIKTPIQYNAKENVEKALSYPNSGGEGVKRLGSTVPGEKGMALIVDVAGVIKGLEMTEAVLSVNRWISDGMNINHRRHL